MFTWPAELVWPLVPFLTLHTHIPLPPRRWHLGPCYMSGTVLGAGLQQGTEQTKITPHELLQIEVSNALSLLLEKVLPGSSLQSTDTDHLSVWRDRITVSFRKRVRGQPLWIGADFGCMRFMGIALYPLSLPGLPSVIFCAASSLLFLLPNIRGYWTFLLPYLCSC